MRGGGFGLEREVRKGRERLCLLMEQTMLSSVRSVCIFSRSTYCRGLLSMHETAPGSARIGLIPMRVGRNSVKRVVVLDEAIVSGGLVGRNA
jgi:hypothetical protein